MITLNNINKSFSDKRVLKDISLVFDPGKTNLIIGESGSGKTVLLKVMIGLYESDSGIVKYDNRNFTEMGFNNRKNLRKEIGMLFQEGALFDYMTVEENIMFPLKMFSEKLNEENLDRVNFCLNRVNLENTNHLFPSELSGGMKKRVAIARSISLNPKYLFCDEPNSGLDPKTSILIDNLIREITQEYNITTIVNSHDMNSVMEIGDKIAFLFQGKIWWNGNKEDLICSENRELNDFVFASKLYKRLKNLG
tara:strand:- start:640 stop:1392 length:753 start_codon:yes stop_codon:yes gene_type:complete